MAYALDLSHSSVTFAVRHLMISKVRGGFQTFTADASFDPASIADGKVTASIDVASLSTGDTQRDGHLKGADFFDAEKHPSISFVSTKAEKKGGGYSLSGNLTIRGTTKPITFDVEVEGPAKDPWGNMRTGFTLKGKLNREAYGLTWNQALEAGGVLVGKEVELGAEIQLIAKP